jgi:hypothetical protein
VNKDRLEQLARTIETLEPSKFDLSKFRHEPCGAPACIAGWAAWEGLGRPGSLPQDVEGVALDWLEVRGYDRRAWVGRYLFQSLTNVSDIEAASVAPAEAAAVVRGLAAMGRIEWSSPSARTHLRVTPTNIPPEE